MKVGKKALFVLDKKFPYLHLLVGEKLFEYAFAEASDDTKRRVKSSEEELARELAEAEVKNDRVTCILIDHMLSTRLLKIQTNVTLVATAIASCATLIAAVLGYFLGAGTNCP
jgi:hypothetical protein